LDKGYTQDQIWQVLAQQGWQPQVLSKIFDELRPKREVIR
jgi:hypothetical protein